MFQYLIDKRKTIAGVCISAAITIGGVMTMEQNVGAICNYGMCFVGYGCNDICYMYPDPIGGVWDPSCWGEECFWYICRVMDVPYCWECSNSDIWQCRW